MSSAREFHMVVQWSKESGWSLSDAESLMDGNVWDWDQSNSTGYGWRGVTDDEEPLIVSLEDDLCQALTRINRWAGPSDTVIITLSREDADRLAHYTDPGAVLMAHMRVQKACQVALEEER